MSARSRSDPWFGPRRKPIQQYVRAQRLEIAPFPPTPQWLLDFCEQVKRDIDYMIVGPRERQK